jgi:hypothetical protein
LPNADLPTERMLTCKRSSYQPTNKRIIHRSFESHGSAYFISPHSLKTLQNQLFLKIETLHNCTPCFLLEIQSCDRRIPQWRKILFCISIITPYAAYRNLSSDKKKKPTAYQSSVRHKGSPSSPLYVSGCAGHLVNYENRSKYTTEPIIFPSDKLLLRVTVDYSSSNMQVHENISVYI